MKKIWIAVGVIVLIVGLVAINVWKKSPGSQANVEVTKLKTETVTETVMTPGQLKLANEQTIFYASDKGSVKEILIKEGDDVDVGTPLIRYENKQLTLEKKQVELQLRLANIQAANLRDQHNKIDELLADDEENEQLQAEHDQVKMQQQQANIEVEQAQLQKELVEQQLKELEVTSDIAGRVVDLNEQAASSSNQLEQEPLIRIGSIDHLIVEGVISEYDTLKIKEDQAVKLTSDAVPDQSWEGKVSLISDLPKEGDSFNMDGGGSGVEYPVRITVNDENIQLKPGFQMVVEITTDEYEAKVLPLTAVQQEGEVNYVYVVKNGFVERRDVTVGSVSTDSIEIIDGLSDDEEVVVEPTSEIQDGMEVTIV